MTVSDWSRLVVASALAVLLGYSVSLGVVPHKWRSVTAATIVPS